MLLSTFLTTLPLVLNHVTASPNPVRQQLGSAVLATLDKRTEELAPLARALSKRNEDDYKPYAVPCPTGWTWVRPADSLGSGEKDYLNKRQQYLSAINTMMSSHGLPNPPRTPVIGAALSGGGYRAMIDGLGMVMATMNDSSEAAASGVGGWYQGLTYMAGLSGGSWGTGTFMANGGVLPLDLINNVWDLESNLVFPSDNQLSFYTDLVGAVASKRDEGFPTQITDYWALALGNHLLASQYHLDNSPNLTFSSLPSVVPALSNGSLPMPIIIAAEREPGEVVIAENATVWEFTPFEFGAWAIGSDDKTQGLFMPIEYLGSSINNGQPNGTCYKGFDQLSFVMGTSSTLFNDIILTLNNTNTSGILVDAIQAVANQISEADNDVSQIPNGFAGYQPDTNPLAKLEYITLFDAGTTNNNVPLEPLLVTERKVDAILAFDNSADTTMSWPNGSSLFTTYSRAKEQAARDNVPLRMSAVPSTNGFINGGWNSRPTFFGCNDTSNPLIVYVPNYPWSAYANSSTFQLDYSNLTAQENMLSAMRSLTLNGSVPTWPQCLACALTDRAFEYTSSNRSSECQACFNTWCWDGTDNTTTPNPYEPVVGTVPSWLTSKNLVKSGSTAAGDAVTPSAQSGAAVPALSTLQIGRGLVGVAVAAAGMMAGGLLVI